MGTVPPSQTLFYPFNYNNIIIFGAQDASEETRQAILTPEEAWNIDKKIDDGRPGLSRLVNQQVIPIVLQAMTPL
jgi:hypothetical protein